MRDSTQNQLRFPAIAGFTVRADFEGGALSSDFGPLLLRGVEQQCGLIGRLAEAINDRRHPSYIEHSVVDLLRQRIYQSACGYVDGNDVNSLRRDPVFKLALERTPLDEATALASGPTFSRLENSLSRKDIYRLGRAFVERFIASNARLAGTAAPGAMRLYDDFDYKARSWAKAYRVVLKAEVMALGATPRFVVTSLGDPSPEALYRDLYCARGQDENFIKAVKNDLASDRTSDHAFLANHLCLFYACAAYCLIHSLRENTLCHTELARAQPMSIILKLFKLAVRVVQYKDRIKLHLPSACPVKGVLHRISEQLYLAHPPPLRR
ncbi:IS1380 family transposase [Marinobacterium rhizophilum]|uniref:IS1380 family transposase n=1 Tax=Marinobacterium rhizophilum TaxID=420402 RepID=UPI00037AB497|nr:IS1380 family transposase [Marinobacterium rhizophilum]